MVTTKIKDLVHRFSYHKPDGLAVISHEEVRDAFCKVAITMEHILPEGREKSLAMTKIEEAMFWANAGIAREIK